MTYNNLSEIQFYGLLDVYESSRCFCAAHVYYCVYCLWAIIQRVGFYVFTAYTQHIYVVNIIWQIHRVKELTLEMSKCKIIWQYFVVPFIGYALFCNNVFSFINNFVKLYIFLFSIKLWVFVYYRFGFVQYLWKMCYIKVKLF